MTTPASLARVSAAPAPRARLRARSLATSPFLRGAAPAGPARAAPVRGGSRAAPIVRASFAGDGGASAVDLLVGSGVLLALASAAARALPALRSADDLDALQQLPPPSSGPAAVRDDDDTNLRWGVAGFVSAFPIFGFVAWLLPAMGAAEKDQPAPEEDLEDPDPDAATRYLGFAALYFLAFASRGFDPASAGTWAVAAACAVNLQLERVAADAANAKRAAAARAAAASAETKRRARKTVASLLGETSSNRAVEDALEPEEGRGRARTRGGTGVTGGKKTKTKTDDAANDGASNAAGWAGGEDPLPSKLRPPALPRVPEIPDVSVRTVGRAIGAGQIKARRLREEVREGKIRAKIEEEERETLETLERERALAEEEISEWDAKFELRTMTRDQLVEIARENNMRGYSKLRRGELLEMVERELETLEEE